jgi:hypothetical protein
MRADSLFTWRFRATTGDMWGGTLVGSQDAFRAGETRAAIAGVYTILAEDPRHQDLSTIGLALHTVFVEWYWDASSEAFLPTRNGWSTPAGMAGLGSEADAAWSGAAWVAFGRGGLDQADAIPAPDDLATVQFTWVFEALTGDIWHGELFDIEGAYAPGQVIAHPLGRYRIQEVGAFPPELGIAAGTVEVAGFYFDSATGTWMEVQHPAGMAGTDGLGSEYGLVLTEAGWMPFGQAGVLQVGDAAQVRHFPFALSSPGFGIQSTGSRIILSDGTAISGFGRTLVFTDGSMGSEAWDTLFDGIYYASTYRDVFSAQIGAREHYMQHGWQEGRDPSAFFSTAGYLSVNSDVRAAGINPLEHYRNWGWREGRDPSASFDVQLYLTVHQDVAVAGLNPLSHYIAYGAAEGRAIFPAIGRALHRGFDADFYRLSYPDIGFAGVDAEMHYRDWGWREGRNPNAWFNSLGYLTTYSDVRAAGMDPLAHYMDYGWREGRDPSSHFDTSAYLASNFDVAMAGIQPLEHFLLYGIYEGRTAQAVEGWA